MRIVFFILLAVLSASFALTETEAEKILERLRAENVNQPIHPEVLLALVDAELDALSSEITHCLAHVNLL